LIGSAAADLPGSTPVVRGAAGFAPGSAGCAGFLISAFSENS
jgi:hypothetical protein